jgi:AraC-like DNA-binding protein
MPRCAVAGVEAVEASTGHTFARHTHDQFGIGVMARGAHRSLSQRGVVEAFQGDVITVNPGEVHDGAPIGEGGRAWSMLYLDPALIAAHGDDIGEGGAVPGEFADPVIRDPALAADFRSLFALMTGALAHACEDRDGLRRDALLLTVLARAMRRSAPPSRAKAAPVAILRARGLIDDDPSAPIALADLARVSGLSRFQVLREFARATGLTPHAYLVQRRIQMARGLIARGEPLAAAAAASGFADQSHMTRLFVRQYGISPHTYALAVR